MHQRPDLIYFFFQREMARIEKMELCVGKLSFIELSALDRRLTNLILHSFHASK